MSKTSIRVAIIGLGIIVGFFFLFSCGGGSSNNSKDKCDAICEKLGGCDPVEFEKESCLDTCSDFDELFRPSVLDAMEACVQDTPCETLDPDVCFSEADAQVPDSVLDDFLDAICTQMASCGGKDKDSCISEARVDPEINGFKKIKDEKLSCVSECFSEIPCEQFNENTMSQCMTDCGLDFGGSEETPCEDFSGDWILESVSCSGVEKDITNVNITLNITVTCYISFQAISEGCTILYQSSLDKNGDLYLNFDSRTCGADCSQEWCTDDSNMDLSVQMSLQMVNSDVVFSYNVTQELVDNDLTPCQVGEFEVAVFGAQ